MTLTHNQPPDNETIAWTANPHYLTQLRYIILGITTLPLGLGIFILLKAYTNISHTTYALTDHAIYKQHGWLTTKTTRIPLPQIQHLTLTQSFTEKHTNTGTLTVNNLQLRAIPEPKQKQTQINQQTQEQYPHHQLKTEIQQTKSNIQKLTDYITDTNKEQSDQISSTNDSGSSSSRSKRMAHRRDNP